VANGVTHVFGGHGGAIVGLIDAIVTHPKLTWVYARCEVNAVQSAMANAKFHNRIGCCIATSGPGAGHLLSGLVDADQDRVPLICITGLKNAGSIRHADFQDIDQGSIFRMAGLGLSESVNHVGQLLPLTLHALNIATTQNRCVHIAVPIDIQLTEIEIPTALNMVKGVQPACQVREYVSAAKIESLASSLIKESMAGTKVVIFCGWRAYPFGEEIEKIAAFLEIPIVTSFDAKGTVNEDHSRSFGVAGMYGFVGGGKSMSVLESCELIVSICLVDIRKAVADKSSMQIRRLLQIDTSLQKGDTLTYLAERQFESVNLKVDLQNVLTAMQEKKDTMELVWKKEERKVFRKCFSVMPTEKNPAKEGSCHPGVFFEIMSDELKEDAVLCADIGDNALWFSNGVKAARGIRTITSQHMGIMGFALNAALGVAVSTGGKNQVLAVAGDGGFQMSLNELATLKDHNCQNVLIVIIVNGTLGRVNNELWGPGVRADGCYIGSPDYVKLFEAYGYPGGENLKTSDREEIRDAICNGWEIAAKQGVSLIVIHQDPEIFPNMSKMDKAIGHEVWEQYTRRIVAKQHASTFHNASAFGGNLPTINFSSEAMAKLETLQTQVDAMSEVKTSSYTYIGEDFLSMYPAKIFQEKMTDIFPGMPEILATDKEKHDFDKAFWTNLMTGCYAGELSEIFDRGSSNGHPLRLQVLAMPRNKNLALHAHPNIELTIGVQGTVYERQLTDFRYPSNKLARNFPKGSFPTDESITSLMDKFKHCVVIEDQGDRSEFLERVYVSKGRCSLNAVGSIHQSYTDIKQGGVLFVLWSGCHANICVPRNVRHQRGIERLKHDI